MDVKPGKGSAVMGRVTEAITDEIPSPGRGDEGGGSVATAATNGDSSRIYGLCVSTTGYVLHATRSGFQTCLLWIATGVAGQGQEIYAPEGTANPNAGATI